MSRAFWEELQDERSGIYTTAEGFEGCSKKRVFQTTLMVLLGLYWGVPPFVMQVPTGSLSESTNT